MSGSAIRDHYANSALLDAIRGGIAALGKTTATVTADDFALLDEFHVGGRAATEAFLDQLDIAPGDRVLDVGCGLGGAARFAVRRYGARVTGIDATADYVEAGRAICGWVGLAGSVELRVCDAPPLPLDDAAFDAAWMMHIGMNVADKQALFAEVYRVLQPGGTFGIDDIMRTGDGEVPYPLPWTTTAAADALSRPDEYRDALESAGFTVIAERNRRDFALAFFDAARARSEVAGGPPPLGIQLVMGSATPRKVRNMVESIRNGLFAPIEMIARKP